MLTAIRKSGMRRGKKYWTCKCDCGKYALASCENLMNGKKNNCGCKGDGTYDSIKVGDKFSKLVVESYYGIMNGRHFYNCICDCGNKIIVAGSELLGGKRRNCGKGHRLSYADAAFNSIINTYKQSARRRNFEFILNDDEFRKLISSNCFYCGSEPKQKRQRSVSGYMMFNGIDRIDSSRGYVPGNVLPCCSTCNFMKRSLRYNDFIAHIEKIYEHIHGGRCFRSNPMQT